MRVTCPQCKVWNDLDDAMIGPSETVIACTRCGHFFKVLNERTEDAVQTRGWMIRKRNGALFKVDRLSHIQKWILQGTITLEDEFSKSGKSWIRLGEISQLAGLFKLSNMDEEEQTQRLYRMDTINLATVEMETKEMDAAPLDAEESPTAPKLIVGRDAADSVTHILPKDLVPSEDRIQKNVREEAETTVLPKDLKKVIRRGKPKKTDE
jgi:predicted Zn finger-like uncharacterized protein